MSLRFFADHCVSSSVIRSLREAGHEVFVLREHIPAESPDGVVIAKAQELQAMLVSLNGDFSEIVRYPPEMYRGIVSLQVADHPEVIPHIMRRLLDFIEAHPDASCYAGRLLLVEPHRIRIRG